MMRLAYLVSQYPASNHTFILREIHQLRALGFEIHIASIRSCDRKPESLTPEERADYQNTFYVLSQGAGGVLSAHLATFLSRPANYLATLLYALRLSRFNLKAALSNIFYFAEAVVVGHWMKQKQITHFHCHFSSTVGLFLSKAFPVTMSITVHGPAEFNDVVGFYLPEKVRQSVFITAISNYGRSQLMRISQPSEWDKLEVSPLGVDPSLFAPRPHRHSPDVFEILCVARLAPVKAQHILIDAVARLLQQGRRLRLRLVGGGPSADSLKAEVARRGLTEQIRIEGPLNQDRVREIYQQTDLFALASFAEGVPVVLMEAMAMEIPCVSTFVNGIPELIRDGVDGLLVPPSDSALLAQAIARLMDDEALRLRLGQSARQRVIDRYDLAKNTHRLAQIFTQHLGVVAEHSAQEALSNVGRVS